MPTAEEIEGAEKHRGWFRLTGGSHEQYWAGLSKGFNEKSVPSGRAVREHKDLIRFSGPPTDDDIDALIDIARLKDGPQSMSGKRPERTILRWQHALKSVFAPLVLDMK